MHLSNKIEEILTHLNSEAKLCLKSDGTLQEKYCALYRGKRRFSSKYTSTEKEVTVFLYEIDEIKKYGENCTARGIFYDILRLATVIHLWVDKQQAIKEIQQNFPELELFIGFNDKNPKNQLEVQWTKVKNNLFSLWRPKEWESRYFEMLNDAKNHSKFKNLFPVTTHFWLRFLQLDKDFRKGHSIPFNIMPTDENIEGRRFVMFNNSPSDSRYFETAKQAFDLYIEDDNAEDSLE